MRATQTDLIKERDTARELLAEMASEGLQVDFSVIRPSTAQLDLSLPMLNVIDSHSVLDSENGQDCRNYGSTDGIPEARRLMAHMLGTHVVHTIVSGNSGWNLIYQVLSHAMLDGVCGGKPWKDVEGRRFICPVPGALNHWRLAKQFGFTLLTVPMRSDGPDMDMVEELIKDSRVKGMWCTPKYQNPTGTVYSSAVIRRLASLKPAAKDFRLFWDNAYAVHDFGKNVATIPDIIEESEKAGNPEIVYEFGTTDLITFPGSGLAAVAAGSANLIDIRHFVEMATTGANKINQLRHVRFLKGSSGLNAHMKKHAAILQPKFKLVENILTRELASGGLAQWTVPKGGYVILLQTIEGTAKKIIQTCAAAGVKLPLAGSAYPNCNDLTDNHISFCPAAENIDEIGKATKVIAYAIRLVGTEAILAAKAGGTLT